MRLLLKTTALIACLGFATMVLAGDRSGITARSNVTDYPVHMVADGFSIGAVVLTPDQVNRLFVTDLNRGYVVVEVGLYPAKGQKVDIARNGFVLRNVNAYLRPVEPKVIAGVLQKSGGSKRQVTLYPTAEVGYDSGPRPYDPYYDGNRGGGLRTGVGVGVGLGNSAPAPTSEADRKTMERELTDKGLPEGSVSAPVAGYLYFPASHEKKNAAYKLEFQAAWGRSQSQGKRVVLDLK